PDRQADRVHCPAGALCQPLLWRAQAQPPVHGRQPLPLFALCEHAGRTRRLALCPTLHPIPVMPGLVPGIHPTKSAGAIGKVDSDDPGQFAGAGKHRNDTVRSVGVTALAGLVAAVGGTSAAGALLLLVVPPLLAVPRLVGAPGLGTAEEAAALDLLGLG